MSSHQSTPEPSVVEVELEAIRDRLIAHPGPAADEAWRLLVALQEVLKYPTMTRDMVSRGSVAARIRNTVAASLSGHLR